MRILYLTDRLSGRGGAGLHLLDVARRAARDASVTIASGRGTAAIEGVRLARVKGLGASVGEGSAGLSRLPGLLAEAEVVHVQNVMNPAALRMIRDTGRAVVTVQDHRVFCPGPGKTLPDGRPCEASMSAGACAGCFEDADYMARTLALTAARRDAMRGARLVVLSTYMAKELAAAGLPGAAVIPPWVPAGDGARPGEGFVVGGRLVSHKAPLDAAAAWRLAGAPERLSVAGAGGLSGALEGPGVRALGWLSRSALRGVLRDARALLFPGRWQEPFGILGVEALAEGTPVIAARVGGVPEWASAGCLLVPPGDVASMADAIQRLQRDPELALSLGRAGRAAVRDRYSEAPLWARLRAIYEAIAQASTE